MAVRTLIVEGWSRLPHSYAHVYRMHCLCLRERPGLSVFRREIPVPLAHWRQRDGLLLAAQQAAFDAIPIAPPGQRADAVLRLSWPPNLTPDPAAERTCVFVTSEQGYPDDNYFAPGTDLAAACRDSRLRFITPSVWSRDGFLRAGAPKDRLVVVPHGVDPALLRPLDEPERREARGALGLGDGPVFLNVSAMTPHKRVDLVVQAFAAILPRVPGAHLVLKGMDDLYQSSPAYADALAALPPASRAGVQSRTVFIPGTIPGGELARWYQAADVYVTPSVAEGFNIPALEAAACGCLVIYTGGIATDEFLRVPFAWKIRSKVLLDSASPRRQFNPDFGHLVELMHRAATDRGALAAARAAGPAHAHSGYSWEKVTDRLVSEMGLG